MIKITLPQISATIIEPGCSNIHDTNYQANELTSHMQGSFEHIHSSAQSWPLQCKTPWE
jgi:hypothetical protein